MPRRRAVRAMASASVVMVTVCRVRRHFGWPAGASDRPDAPPQSRGMGERVGLDRRRTLVGAGTQVGTEVSINLGSALAGVAIPFVGSPIVVAARQLVMVAVLLPFYRPRRTLLTWRRLWPAVALGVTLAIMTLTFYESVHLLGLGIAATIEFLGPLLLALATSRRVLDVVCVLVAGAGVVLLTGLRSEEHTSELQSRENLVCRLLLEKKKKTSRGNV